MACIFRLTSIGSIGRGTAPPSRYRRIRWLDQSPASEPQFHPDPECVQIDPLASIRLLLSLLDGRDGLAIELGVVGVAHFGDGGLDQRFRCREAPDSDLL